MNKLITSVYNLFLSNVAKKKLEKSIIYISIISFLVHLFLILITDLGFINIKDFSGLLQKPIVAIYTPFSFILLYEVYLLVYYLPKSTTKYIGKQYEIVTLIVIRRIFKDIYNIKFTTNWFSEKDDILVTLDILAVLILFYLIYVFYKIVDVKQKTVISFDVENFIKIKKGLAALLIPVMLILAAYNLFFWTYENFFTANHIELSLKNINKIFFDDFFTILILVDVLILLFSFLYTDKFNQVIRNSGFIISTILIKFSFQIEGIFNAITIVFAVLFGVLILYLHNKYEKLDSSVY